MNWSPTQKRWLLGVSTVGFVLLVLSIALRFS